MHDIFEISFESKCTCFLSAVLRTEGQIISHAQATGFFWRHNDIPYLITNRHNVTGLDSSNRRIGTFIPNGLQVHFWEKTDETCHNYTFHRIRAIEAALWKDGYPDWLEHPRGPEIDIVALPLNSPEKISVNCINDKKQYENWKVEAGADCFIVGYPEKISGPQGTPIWKRASIASEPQLDYKGLPLFLCDSATRKGMSGGAVFGKAQGFFDAQGQRLNPYGSAPQFFGHWSIFLGIYSGREGEEQDGFQLGRVWKRSALNELLNAQKLADVPGLV